MNHLMLVLNGLIRKKNLELSVKRNPTQQLMVFTVKEGSGGAKNWTHEPDVQHATAGILAQAAIRLLYRPTRKRPARNGPKRQIGRKNGVIRMTKRRSAGHDRAVATLTAPMAAGKLIDQGAPISPCCSMPIRIDTDRKNA